MLLQKAFLVGIYDGGAVKSGTCAVSEHKHFRRSQSDQAEERTRLSPGEGQDDAEQRTNSGGNKERHGRAMLGLGNKFRVRIELRKQIGLATGATGVHQPRPGWSACRPPSGNAQCRRASENGTDKRSLDSPLSEQAVKSGGYEQTKKQRR